MNSTRSKHVLYSLAIAGSLVWAGNCAAYVSDGHEYSLRCTKRGYVLRSKFPVRKVGTGAGTRYISGREELYLGRSCDASHRIFGKGKWCWSNGAFGATFDEHEFVFSRQDLRCPKEPDYYLQCSC